MGIMLFSSCLDRHVGASEAKSASIEAKLA
jgi:hypothetical protein